MSVFNFLRKKSSAHAGKKLANELTRGLRYVCYDFNKRKSDFLDKVKQTYPMTLVAYIKDASTNNKYFITCPALYNNDLSEAQIKELKDAISQGKPPFVVYNGKDGNRNELITHEHDEGVDDELLQRYIKKEQEDADNTSPPNKKSRPSTSSEDSLTV